MISVKDGTYNYTDVSCLVLCMNYNPGLCLCKFCEIFNCHHLYNTDKRKYDSIQLWRDAILGLYNFGDLASVPHRPS